MADGAQASPRRSVEGNQSTSLCVQMMTGLQGLMSQVERGVERQLSKVCTTAKMFEDAADKSMTAMARIYNNKRSIVVESYTSELKFVELAERLARNLTSLRRRSSGLSQQLEELRRNAQKQMDDFYRTEVDVDMKLRACRGSCRMALAFSVKHRSYQTLQTDLDQVDQSRKAATPPKDIPHIKVQQIDVGAAPPAEYKTIPIVQRELLTQFEYIGQNQVVLEEPADEDALEPAQLE